MIDENKKVPGIKEDDEHVTIFLNREEEEQKREREKLWFTIFGISMISITLMAILVAILSFVATTRFGKQKKEIELPYIVKDETIVKYHNLYNYLNEETKENDPTKSIKTITALSFGEGEMKVFGDNDGCSIVYSIKNVQLENFTESKAVATYEINMSFVTIQNDTLNVGGSKNVGKVYTINGGNGDKFISYTTMDQEKNIASCVNESYSAEGLYPNEIKISSNSNPSLYDFYYYLLNK